MKQKLTVLVMFVLMIGLSACGNKEGTTANSKTADSSEVKAPDDEEIFDRLSELLPTVNTDNYNEDEYLGSDYKSLLRNPLDHAGEKLGFINFDVIQVIKEGKYQKLLVVTQPKDLYMLVIEDSRLESKLLEGDTLHVNGRFLTTYKYIANNNTEKEVPLIYIDAYTLVGD